jgi:glutathione synthase/RimK-type ligase-like ATP-grasp enzyme
VHVLFVVDRPSDWPLAIPGVEVVAARRYVEDAAYSRLSYSLVFNLCRSYSYQRLGYYVSLLAEARGHRAWPSIATIADLNSQVLTRIASVDLSDTIATALRNLRSDEFLLSIYFGRSLARRHASLARALSEQFEAPLLRARFARVEGSWKLEQVRPIPVKEVPESHFPFVIEAAQAWLGRRRRAPRKAKVWRAHVALLVDEDEANPPSNERALRRFERVAKRMSVRVERIGARDISRLPGFDALWIRATTRVGHFTHRFAQRAEAEGLVVIDDPVSIVRCTNKVYLAELLERHELPAPRTMIVHRGNRDQVAAVLGLPCVLKQPDGAFSTGVIKASDQAELDAGLDRLMVESELVVAQEFVPTEFDWRVGVLGGEPLFVCRYFMAPKHWQIVKRGQTGEATFGKVDTLPVAEAPKRVVRAAVRAARLIGDGLYGVDLKQYGTKVRIVEVNDNPNLDGGYEDKVLGDALYERLVQHFLDRIARDEQGTHAGS